MTRDRAELTNEQVFAFTPVQVATLLAQGRLALSTPRLREADEAVRAWRIIVLETHRARLITGTQARHLLSDGD